MSVRIGALLFAVVVATSRLASAADRDLPQRGPISQDGVECLPQKIEKGVTLHVQLPPNHGGDLAVIDPTGEYFFIAFEQPDKASAVIPPMPSVVLRSLSAIDLPISTIAGIAWSKRQKAQPIFTAPGRYKLVLSPALQTEDPELDGWCYLYFK